MDDVQTQINFRLFPAYRKHKHKQKNATVAASQTVTSSDHADTSLHDGGQLFPPEVERVSPDDRSSLLTLASLTKPPEQEVRRSNRKRKLMKVCKRLAAFLLSTVGLTVLTVFYAVAGGYMFSALESHNEQTVQTGVTDALRWHIEALWNNTRQLNILHPVYHCVSVSLRHTTHEVMRRILCACVFVCLSVCKQDNRSGAI